MKNSRSNRRHLCISVDSLTRKVSGMVGSSQPDNKQYPGRCGKHSLPILHRQEETLAIRWPYGAPELPCQLVSTQLRQSVRVHPPGSLGVWDGLLLGNQV